MSRNRPDARVAANPAGQGGGGGGPPSSGANAPDTSAKPLLSAIESSIPAEILGKTTREIQAMTMMMHSQIGAMSNEANALTNQIKKQQARLLENMERIKLQAQLPHMVATVTELLDLRATGAATKRKADVTEVCLDEDESASDGIILKTSTRVSVFVPNTGLADKLKLKPGDLVGVNKESFVLLSVLPNEYDQRVIAMEVDERPKEQWSDVGGLEKQITELIEAVVLPITHKERFVKLGISPPKGVLLYGPPGTGKTMLARAVAAQTKSTFLRLAGPQLVQMYIGDGARMIRDAFALAKEKAPSIIFIDELDAIGTKRVDTDRAGGREVQRTMLELLNQLDGFQQHDAVKVIAATNRVDVLDPALVRSGRLDKKIELPAPDAAGRAHIVSIHARKMKVCEDVDYAELARCTEDFNGAQCRAVAIEAGMIALRRDAKLVVHEDFMDAILEVKAAKKGTAVGMFA